MRGAFGVICRNLNRGHRDFLLTESSGCRLIVQIHRPHFKGEISEGGEPGDLHVDTKPIRFFPALNFEKQNLFCLLLFIYKLELPSLSGALFKKGYCLGRCV